MREKEEDLRRLGSRRGSDVQWSGQETAVSQSSKEAGSRREMQNANFCHLLPCYNISTTRARNVI